MVNLLISVQRYEKFSTYANIFAFCREKGGISPRENEKTSIKLLETDEEKAPQVSTH